MSRHIGIVYVGALLIVAAGCSLDSFSLWPISPRDHKQIVAGSVDQVSAKLQEGLSEAGIVVLVKHKNEERRLFCQTKSGTRYCLMLNEEKTKGSDSTIVTMWDKAVDEPSWRLVVKILTAPVPASDDSLRLSDAADQKEIPRE
jgi:hypothetical protein